MRLSGTPAVNNAIPAYMAISYGYAVLVVCVCLLRLIWSVVHMPPSLKVCWPGFCVWNVSAMGGRYTAGGPRVLVIS